MNTRHDAPHWLEVVDGQGLLPAKLLGPFPTEHLAARAQRGVMRLLNAARYTAAVLSQRELERRMSDKNSPSHHASP
jgi:hypothetical protein